MAKSQSTGVSREQQISAICATGCGVLALGLPIGVVTLWALAPWEILALVRLIPPDILYDMGTSVLLCSGSSGRSSAWCQPCCSATACCARVDPFPRSNAATSLERR